MFSPSELRRFLPQCQQSQVLVTFCRSSSLSENMGLPEAFNGMAIREELMSE
jgi:hypothetical protein